MVSHASSYHSSAAANCSMRRSAAMDREGRSPLPAAISSWRSKTAVRSGGMKARTMVIRRKVEALRRLVPCGGGEGSTVFVEEEDDRAVEEVLFRAADYIVRLQVQVKAMQLLVHVLEHDSKDDSS